MPLSCLGVLHPRRWPIDTMPNENKFYIWGTRSATHRICLCKHPLGVANARCEHVLNIENTNIETTGVAKARWEHFLNIENTFYIWRTHSTQGINRSPKVFLCVFLYVFLHSTDGEHILHLENTFYTWQPKRWPAVAWLWFGWRRESWECSVTRAAATAPGWCDLWYYMYNTIYIYK